MKKKAFKINNINRNSKHKTFKANFEYSSYNINLLTKRGNK